MSKAILISAADAPAIGDVRLLGSGDTIYTQAGWTKRGDVGRYADAIGAAVMRGASVIAVPADVSLEETARSAWKATQR